MLSLWRDNLFLEAVGVSFPLKYNAKLSIRVSLQSPCQQVNSEQEETVIFTVLSLYVADRFRGARRVSTDGFG